jgi:flagellar biosynthesis protein FlhF
MRASDLGTIVDRYSVFNPSKLLFTRLDESSKYGPLINECHRTAKPISFLSTGDQIPEDLEPAIPARIASLLLGTALPQRRVAAPGEEFN